MIKSNDVIIINYCVNYGGCIEIIEVICEIVCEVVVGRFNLEWIIEFMIVCYLQ